eukprot:COSAG01_NODE_1298_length_10837_cov_44.666108_5_plen_110_part_00
MRDVGEGPRVDEDRRALHRLHERRHDRLLHQDRQRAAAADVVAGDRIASARLPDHHRAQALAQITQVRGQRQHRHDLRSHLHKDHRPPQPVMQAQLLRCTRLNARTAMS